MKAKIEQSGRKLVKAVTLYRLDNGCLLFRVPLVDKLARRGLFDDSHWTKEVQG